MAKAKVPTETVDTKKAEANKAFFDVALKWARGDRQKLRKLKRTDLIVISNDFGVAVPRDAWRARPERGRYDLTLLEGQGNVADKAKGKIDLNRIGELLGMKEEKDGSVTLAGGQLSFARGTSPSAVASILRNYLMLSTVDPTFNKVMDPRSVEDLFTHLNDLIDVVAKGNVNSLFVYGGPGIGKTYTVLERVADLLNMKKNVDYFVIRGKVTTASLYQTLFMHRKGKLIIFDDTDSAFENEDSANILKAALDSYDKRTLSWLSNRTVNVSLWDEEKRQDLEDKVDKLLRGYSSVDTSDDNEDDGNDDGEITSLDEELFGEGGESDADKHMKKLRRLKFPSEFDFESRVIFISNLNHEFIDPAVLSRSLKIDMSLTIDQMFERTEKLLPKMGDPELSVSQKKEILAALKNKHALGEIVEPNMRTFVAACHIAKTGKKNWMDLVRYT